MAGAAGALSALLRLPAAGAVQAHGSAPGGERRRLSADDGCHEVAGMPGKKNKKKKKKKNKNKKTKHE